MRTKKIFIALILLINQQLVAQSQDKITGPLGVYHTSAGYCYSDTTGIDSAQVEYEFRFGELAFSNQDVDNGFGFQQDIDSCNQWNANRVLGIIQPPTENGVYNQPADTSLYSPFDLSNKPGMIQGAHRFSKLSQLYGSFCGIILDDWNGDTAITHQLRDALQGKEVDANGNINSNSEATTPTNKLYAVIYNTAANPAALPYIDGFSYWYVDAQNCCYANLDNDINQLRTNFARKEIFIGIYLQNNHLGWTDPLSVQYMLQHSIDRYDNGDINGITIFAGPFLAKSYITLSQWKAYALPNLLDSLYYPYLGTGEGNLYDCKSGNVLTDAFVRVFCKGRLSGDTLMRSRQKTDALGHYQFGLWAGNRNTDSTYYWAVGEKSGYANDTIGFWIKRNEATNIPNLSLCFSDTTLLNNSKDNMLVFPNPAGGRFTIDVKTGRTVIGNIDIYDVEGRKVYLATQLLKHSVIDLSSKPNGVYLIRVTTSQPEINLKRIVVLQH